MQPLVSYDISSSDSDEEHSNSCAHGHNSIIRCSNVDKDSICVKNMLDHILSDICSALDHNVTVKNEPINDYDDDYRGPLRRDDMVIDRYGYRDMTHHHVIISDSGSSDESSSLSSDEELSRTLRSNYNSDDSDYVFESILIASRRLKKTAPKPCIPLKTKGELSVRDLPNIEDLHISLPSHVSLMKLGVITSIVDTLVVIMSEKNTPALDQDTLLFTEDRNSFGKVFEIFGPVIRPYYSVRFNNEEDIKAAGVDISTPIFFAPQVPEYTHGIFAEQLQQMKGSDASWLDNNEPPPEALDFSDDEQERRFKAQRRQQAKNSRAIAISANSTENSDVMILDSDDVSSVDGDSTGVQQSPRGRGRGRGKKQRWGRGSRPQNNNSNRLQVRAWPPSSSQHLQRSQALSSSSSSATGDQNYNSYYNGHVTLPNVHNWMWMSEGVFRMPQPRFDQHAFARANAMFQHSPFPMNQQYPGYQSYPPALGSNNRPP